MLDIYFKIKTIENGRRGLISDFTNLRNQIAHGNFITKNEEIIIYPNLNEKEFIRYTYDEILNIFNIILVKWSFILILISLQWYIFKISGFDLFRAR